MNRNMHESNARAARPVPPTRPKRTCLTKQRITENKTWNLHPEQVGNHEMNGMASLRFGESTSCRASINGGARRVVPPDIPKRRITASFAHPNLFGSAADTPTVCLFTSGGGTQSRRSNSSDDVAFWVTPHRDLRQPAIIYRSRNSKTHVLFHRI